MPKTKEQLVEQAQLVRTHEANCKIEHPTPEESRFRIAVMKQLGLGFGLAAMRKVEIGGAGAEPAKPAQPGRGK